MRLPEFLTTSIASKKGRSEIHFFFWVSSEIINSGNFVYLRITSSNFGWLRVNTNYIVQLFGVLPFTSDYLGPPHGSLRKTSSWLRITSGSPSSDFRSLRITSDHNMDHFVRLPYGFHLIFQINSRATLFFFKSTSDNLRGQASLRSLRISILAYLIKAILWLWLTSGVLGNPGHLDLL